MYTRRGKVRPLIEKSIIVETKLKGIFISPLAAKNAVNDVKFANKNIVTVELKLLILSLSIPPKINIVKTKAKQNKT